MKAVVLITVLAAGALPATAQDYSTKDGCMTELATAVQRADGYKNLPEWFEKKLAESPSRSEAKEKIVAAHEEIAAAMRAIAEETFILCSSYD